MTQSPFAALPKIDLHCHLDGSLQPRFVAQVLAQTQGITLDEKELAQRLQVPDPCQSLTQYLKCFDLPIVCMQTPAQIRQGAYEFVASLQADHVRYIEVRFSPALFINPELTERQALEATLAGLKQGQEAFGIYVNTIVCGMRHFDFARNAQSFRLAKEYAEVGVCGLDLAGDESGFATASFAQLFALARTLQLPFTIHAGECGSSQSVADAISFGAGRIGHGIAMAQRPDLQALCVEKAVGVELCPISNYQTKAVQPGTAYPLDAFLQADMCATVNTDNRTVSNTTLTKEFLFLQDCCDFTVEDAKKVTLNAITCAFASEDVKHQLWKQCQ